MLHLVFVFAWPPLIWCYGGVYSPGARSCGDQGESEREREGGGGRERKREREGEREGERETERERERVTRSVTLRVMSVAKHKQI